MSISPLNHTGSNLVVRRSWKTQTSVCFVPWAEFTVSWNIFTADHCSLELCERMQMMFARNRRTTYGTMCTRRSRHRVGLDQRSCLYSCILLFCLESKQHFLASVQHWVTCHKYYRTFLQTSDIQIAIARNKMSQSSLAKSYQPPFRKGSLKTFCCRFPPT